MTTTLPSLEHAVEDKMEHKTQHRVEINGESKSDEFLTKFNSELRGMSRASTKHASGAEQKCTTREVIGQRKCPGQLFGRSVTEAGWQQAGE